MTVPYSARAYRAAEILAASPTRLVVITYDGLLASLMRARAGAVAGDLDVLVPAIARSRDFVIELLGALDRENGGDIAGRLSNIYVFVLAELQTISRTRDPKRLDAISELMRELREAFATIAVTPLSMAPRRSVVA